MDNLQDSKDIVEFVREQNSKLRRTANIAIAVAIGVSTVAVFTSATYLLLSWTI